MKNRRKSKGSNNCYVYFVIYCRDLLHLLENTFNLKGISANPNPNLIPNSNPNTNPKAQ